MFSPWSEHSYSRPAPGSRAAARSRAVTLLELLIALSIMVMVVGVLGAITRAIQLGFEYNEGYGAATQHARVAMERITRTAREATANERFPGFIVLADNVDSWRFPDTLVVWHPDGPAAFPEGLPRLSELVIYCPNPNDPGALVEITTDETDSLSDSEDDWASQIEAIKHSQSSAVTTLTGLLRANSVRNSGDPQLRGAVRFETLLRPSAEEWADAGIPWEELPWVQGIYGSQTGLRQAWLRIELQLMTGEPPAAGTADRRQAIPFLGSAALHYTMNRDRR